MLTYINFFGKDIPVYALCAIVGVLFSILLFVILHRKNPRLNSVQKANVPVVAMLGVFIGAHLLYGITHMDSIVWVICHLDTVFESFEIFSAYMSDIFGGMVFYGGLLGGLAAGAIYCKYMGLDPWVYGDAYAPCIPLFHAFGRVGCFLAGCCYGIESTWGIVYENAPDEAANGVMRLPIQLFEAAGELAICAVLVIVFLRLKKPKAGTLLCLYFLMYTVLRFITEFFRGDEIRGIFLGFSTSQWISMLLFVLSAIKLISLYHRKIPDKKFDVTEV